METIIFLLDKFPVLLVILLRISGFFISAPVFNSRNLPVQLKAAFTLLVSVFIYFLLYNTVTVPEINFGFIFLLLREFIIGLIMGYTAQLLFSAIQLAGQSIDMQMGFGMVNVMDPQSGLQVPLMGTFYNLLAILVFFLINGHHYLLEALFYSYKVLPLGALKLKASFYSLITDLTAELFIIAFKLAAPMVGALFIADFVMGIISRTVPQMNVFLVGMPAKILFGFLVLLLIVPFYIYLLTSLMERSFQDLFQIIKVLK
ncbi:MAG: flagellar type III secretion system protein FliR [Clostridia bacterium]|nr:flagellar type III secretion system protein FliR [Clostridia bacterium]